MIINVGRPSVQLRVVLRQVGYSEFNDPRRGQVSFVRRLGRLFYPRFHLYVDEQPTQLRLNLHLDQKQPSYAGSHQHSGEYDGPLVEQEAERIKSFFPPR